MADFCNVFFQFRLDEVALSDYIRFDSRGTADTEGGKVDHGCMENGDAAVTAVLGGRIGFAVLEGLEFASMAAGGKGLKGSSTHYGREIVLKRDVLGKVIENK